MTAAQFDAWSGRSVTGFAAQQVAAGLQPEPEALAYAEAQLEALLPEGPATPQHSLWRVLCGDDAVGHLWMRVRPLSDEVEAYVFDIEIDSRFRGRGLGRATMLTAEATAREQGADVVRLNVFGHNESARRLYDSLGYAVSAATMTKRLPREDRAAAGPGPRVALRDMTAEEYVRLRPRLEADLVADLVRAGAMPVAEARRKAADDFAWRLPRGRSSPGNLMWTAYADGRTVGSVWVTVHPRSDGRHAIGHHLEIAEDLRRRGYGRAVVAEAERGCRALGVTSVEVSVFGFHTGARSLYERAGFEVTALSMAKRV